MSEWRSSTEGPRSTWPKLEWHPDRSKMFAAACEGLSRDFMRTEGCEMVALLYDVNDLRYRWAYLRIRSYGPETRLYWGASSPAAGVGSSGMGRPKSLDLARADEWRVSFDPEIREWARRVWSFDDFEAALHHFVTYRQDLDPEPAGSSAPPESDPLAPDRLASTPEPTTDREGPE